MQTALADFIRDTPDRSRSRPDPACLRALRILHCDLSHLPVARRRTRRAARANLPDQAGARRRTGQRDRAPAPRSLSHLSRVRNHLPVRRELSPSARHRPRTGRATGTPVAVQQLLRRLLIEILAYPKRFTPLLRIGQGLRPLMPPAMRKKMPVGKRVRRLMGNRAAARRVLVLEGCVQPGLAPGDQQRARARAAAARYRRAACAGGGLLRRGAAPPGRPGACARNGAPQYRRLVSGDRGRRRGPGRHRQRLRRPSARLPQAAGRGSRLCGQGRTAGERSRATRCS